VLSAKQCAVAAKLGQSVHHTCTLRSIHPRDLRRYESSAPGVPTSQNWEASASYQAQSLAFLDKLASRYASSPALVAIGLLNKPTVRLTVSCRTARSASCGSTSSTRSTALSALQSIAAGLASQP